MTALQFVSSAVLLLLVNVDFTEASRSNDVRKLLDAISKQLRIPNDANGNLSALPDPPQYMLNLYQKYKENPGWAAPHVATAYFDQSISDSVSCHDSEKDSTCFRSFVFQVGVAWNGTRTMKVDDIRLRLYWNAAPTSTAKNISIDVTVGDADGDETWPCASHQMGRRAVTKARWLQFDVRDCLRAGMSRVEFRAVVRGSPEVATTGFSESAANQRQAFLVISETGEAKNKVAGTDHVRSRRSVSTPKSRNGSNKSRYPCARKELYVDFTKVGWSWVIAPTGYKAYYCDGQCSWPLADRFHPSTHAIIQYLMRRSGMKSLPKPCCVPTKLSSSSMLYRDSQGRIVYKVLYGDMVAERCGCR